MNLANVNVDIDQEQIKAYIYGKIDQALHQTLLYWDINVMAQRMSLSRSFLEQEFLNDDRMRLLQRQKEKGKRIWPVGESLAVMEQIMDQDW